MTRQDGAGTSVLAQSPTGRDEPAAERTRRGEDATRRVEALLLHDRRRRTVSAPAGLIEAVEETGGGRFEYSYDRRGDLTGIAEATGRRATFEYDDSRRLARVGHPDGTATEYVYEGGRLIGARDRGVARRFEYDDAGRVTRIRHGDSGASVYRYDDQGRVTEARTSTVSTAQRFHPDGRVAAIRQSYDGVTIELRLEYDDAGRLAELHLPGSGRAVRYAWDERGRPHTVSLGEDMLARFEYLDERRCSRVHLGNGLVEESDADPVDGRPVLRRVLKGNEALFEREYAYGPEGRPAGDGVRRYEYDALDRLVGVEETRTGRRWRYGYDAQDNRTWKEEPGGGCRYRYDADDRLVGVETDEGSSGISYDLHGRPVRKDGPEGRWTYRYNDAGWLLETRHRGETVARFTYDHKGRLAAMLSSRRSERYLYDPDDRLVAVTDMQGTPSRLYVWTPLGLLAEVRGSPDGDVAFHHGDHQGTRHAVSDGSGRIAGRWEYDPFGVPSGSQDAFLPMYCGRTWYPEVGMYYFGARWYDPCLGRFLTPDTYTGRPDDERLVHPCRPAGSQGFARSQILADWLKEPRVRNRYAFCANDPVGRLDPNGHWSFGWVLLSILGAIWTLPNTLIGLFLEITCLVGEVIRWFVWLVSGGNVSWETPGFDVAASGRLNAFALVFRGGWLGSIPSLHGITFGNIFFVYGKWDQDPHWKGTDPVFPPAYEGKVSIPRNLSLYEHELRHTNQYGWFGPFFHLGLPIFGVYVWDVILHGYRNAWFERDARDHSEGPGPGPTPVPGLEIVVQTQAQGATPAPLAGAWVYWLQGTTITVLRTDPAGRLLTAAAGQDPTRSQSYTQPFTAPAGTAAQIFASRGARPVPDAYLLANPDIFHSRTVGTPSVPTTGPGALPAVTVLPEAPVRLTKPRELSIWPLLREPVTDAYYTRGLAQGATLWGGAGLTVTEHGLAPAAAAAVRPRERGLALEGTIDARATAVTIQILDASGAPIQLRENRAATAGVDRITATLRTAVGNTKPFEATIYLLDPAAAFGPVQVVVQATGVTPRILEVFSCHLAGLQVALVNDQLANPNGQSPGPVPGTADELIVVDFLDSPQPNLADISAQTRARAMVTYLMGHRDRALSATDATLVRKPEMPLWMAEFQILGLSRTQLEDLMARRKHVLPGNPASLRFDLRWGLSLRWDGPDVGTGSPRIYRYSQSFPDSQAVTISLATNDRIDGVDAQGRVASALSPAPTAMAFPVAGRRLPQVIVSNQTRRWGREGAAPLQDTVVIEWQPRIVNGAGEEIMRGGDGDLTLENLTIAGEPVDPGLIPAGTGVAPPPATTPAVDLPRFRVRGLDPPPPHDALIDALVAEYVNRNAAVARVALLPLAVWQETIRLILTHEAGRQFENRGAGRRRFAGTYYGHEQDMPFFGAPHGYGYGQHDNPPVSDDGAWSFFENLKETIERVMGDRRDDKAIQAYNHLRGHLPTPPNRRIRAVYRREVVRRYNGGSEFRWNGADWEIDPSLSRWADAGDRSQGANQRLPYPNRVLGTNVVYFTGTGAATVFPWPIAFAAGDYGPGI